MTDNAVQEVRMAKRHPGLSERHRKILEFLGNFQETNGYSPSIRQIGDSINVKSTSLIDYYLSQLQEMVIDREPHLAQHPGHQECTVSAIFLTKFRGIRNASNALASW
jgi:SOS-response transcriptional repressor LexA